MNTTAETAAMIRSLHERRDTESPIYQHCLRSCTRAICRQRQEQEYSEIVATRKTLRRRPGQVSR